MGHHHTARAGGGQAKKENREQWQRGTPCQAGRASLPFVARALGGTPVGTPSKGGLAFHTGSDATGANPPNLSLAPGCRVLSRTSLWSLGPVTMTGAEAEGADDPRPSACVL